MTELEFKNTNPVSYGEGNVNLLYSSSISTGSYELPSNKYGASGSFAYDKELNGVGTGPNFKEYYLADGLFPPYRILGLTIPFQSANAVQLEQTLSAVTKIRFDFGGSEAVCNVDQVTKRAGYFHIRVFPLNIFTFLEGVDNSGTPYIQTVEFIFEPYLAAKFNNSDFNALIGNASTTMLNSIAVELDKNTNQLYPSNLDAVVNGTATAASIQDSNYQIAGWTNARYYGSKNTSTIGGDYTSNTYASFKGVIYPKDANVATILASTAGDVSTVYFDETRLPTSVVRSGSIAPEPFVTASAYPIPQSGTGAVANFDGNYVYEEQGNKLIKITEKRIHAVDKGLVYETDRNGRVLKQRSS